MTVIRVTCPETAHLETIEYLESPLGMLVKSCTRFPGCTMSCPRTCAARLDQRQRLLEVGDDTQVIKLVG